jgi:hypothetical protein
MTERELAEQVLQKHFGTVDELLVHAGEELKK